jgi:hypothetical protein
MAWLLVFYCASVALFYAYSPRDYMSSYPRTKLLLKSIYETLTLTLWGDPQVDGAAVYIVLLLAEAFILWAVYLQVRVLHILYLGTRIKPRRKTWAVVLKYCISLQFIGFLIFLAFWKQSLTMQEHISYLYNAFFHTVMLQGAIGKHLWFNGFDHELLRHYSILKLAAVGIFCLFAVGNLAMYDVLSIRRLRARVRWPRRSWQKATRFALYGFGLLLLSGWVLQWIIFPETNEPLVAQAINMLFDTAGAFGEFSWVNGWGMIFAFLTGTPFGSATGLGLMGLIMLLMLPAARRIFSPAGIWRGVGYYFLFLIIIIAILILFIWLLSMADTRSHPSVRWSPTIVFGLLPLKLLVPVLMLTQREIRKLKREELSHSSE